MKNLPYQREFTILIYFVLIFISFSGCKKDSSTETSTTGSTNSSSQWTPCMNGFASGSFPLGVVFSNNILYCLTAYNKVYSSTDLGNTWISTSNVNLPQDNSGGGTAFSSFSFANNIFFVGQPFGSLYKSTNNTNTWQIQGGLSGMSGSLSFDPGSNTYFCISNQKIYSSSNSGNTWTQSTTGIPTGANCVSLFYNAQGHFITSAFAPAALYFSNDGNSWSPIPAPSGIAGINCINENDSLVLFAGTSNGLYKSSDWLNWSLVSSIPSIQINSIKISNNKILVSGLNGGEIYYSNDSGNSFISYNTGIPSGGMQMSAEIILGQGFISVQGQLYKRTL